MFLLLSILGDTITQRRDLDSLLYLISHQLFVVILFDMLVDSLLEGVFSDPVLHMDVVVMLPFQIRALIDFTERLVLDNSGRKRATIHVRDTLIVRVSGQNRTCGSSLDRIRISAFSCKVWT